jgi:hypothetical protein
MDPDNERNWDIHLPAESDELRQAGLYTTAVLADRVFFERPEEVEGAVEKISDAWVCVMKNLMIHAPTGFRLTLCAPSLDLDAPLDLAYRTRPGRMVASIKTAFHPVLEYPPLTTATGSYPLPLRTAPKQRISRTLFKHYDKGCARWIRYMLEDLPFEEDGRNDE